MPLPSVIKTTNKAMSFYVLGITVVFVIYLLLAFVFGAYNFFLQLPEILEFAGGGDFSEAAKHRQREIEVGILHFIAFTIVSVKAYSILISYAKTHHLNLKFLVEIAIIASAIELLFNSHAYSLPILIVFAAFGLINLVLYLMYYEKFKEIAKDDDDPEDDVDLS